jgi:hypothetical protein
MTASDDEALKFGTVISDAHWTRTSYEQAMQLGIEALRSSYALPSRLEPGETSEHWIRMGHYRALQAAAWFAFARERRWAGNPPVDQRADWPIVGPVPSSPPPDSPPPDSPPPDIPQSG